MSAREFVEWQAYFALEPFGEERADLRSAIVAATIANRLRGQNEQPKQPSDFMPYREQAPPTPEDLLAKFAGAVPDPAGN